MSKPRSRKRCGAESPASSAGRRIILQARTQHRVPGVAHERSPDGHHQVDLVLALRRIAHLLPGAPVRRKPHLPGAEQHLAHRRVQALGERMQFRQLAHGADDLRRKQPDQRGHDAAKLRIARTEIVRPIERSSRKKTAAERQSGRPSRSAQLRSKRWCWKRLTSSTATAMPG
ncbi:MAG: hypothetical protein MZW92_36905 [Comamonadaceae bacterium]|nr:hypothetical protein [Comamonadaceae bacterium]